MTGLERWDFSRFHINWIAFLMRALNGGILPPNLYAISDQITSGFGPEVLTLQLPDNINGVGSGAVATKSAPPKMRF